MQWRCMYMRLPAFDAPPCFGWFTLFVRERKGRSFSLPHTCLSFCLSVSHAVVFLTTFMVASLTATVHHTIFGGLLSVTIFFSFLRVRIVDRAAMRCMRSGSGGRSARLPRSRWPIFSFFLFVRYVYIREERQQREVAIGCVRKGEGHLLFFFFFPAWISPPHHHFPWCASIIYTSFIALAGKRERKHRNTSIVGYERGKGVVVDHDAPLKARPSCSGGHW